MGFGKPGGVGAGPPPRASLFGVRSLSLVLPDFGTLLFFVLLFMFILSFLFCCSVLRSTQFEMIRNRARASKLSKDLKMGVRYLVNQQVLMQRSVPKKFYN